MRQGRRGSQDQCALLMGSPLWAAGTGPPNLPSALEKCPSEHKGEKTLPLVLSSAVASGVAFTPLHFWMVVQDPTGVP